MPRSLKYVVVSIVLLAVACGPQVLHPKGNMRAVPGVHPEELEEVYTPKKIALLVGINSFEDSGWRPLRFASNDAKALSDLLKDPSKGGFNEVITLNTPEKSTRASILSAIDHISNLNTHPADTVLIYFSTHGTLEKDSNGNLHQYLVASDTRIDEIQKTGIDLTDLQTRFVSLRSRRKVMILATCHSGSGKSSFNGKMIEELSLTKAGFFVKPLEVVSEASVILSACAWGETAREDPKLRHDIYTYFFIEALVKFDANGDGAVTASEAHDYAREKTYYYTRGQQRPSALSDILGSDPIVLTGSVKRIGKPALYSYNQSMEDVEIYVDGQPKGKLPGSIIVDPGIRMIALKKPGQQKAFFENKVKFIMGKRVDAVDLIKMVTVDQTLGVGVSYRAFISDEVNQSVYAPMLMYGLTYGRNGPLQNTRWETSLFAGSTSDTIDFEGIELDTDFTRADLEGALLWHYQRGKLTMAGGPVIGLVYLARELPEEVENHTQHRLTGLIGPMVNFEVTPAHKWIMGLGGEINLGHLEIETGGRFELGYATTIYVKYHL